MNSRSRNLSAGVAVLGVAGLLSVLGYNYFGFRKQLPIDNSAVRASQMDSFVLYSEKEDYAPAWDVLGRDNALAVAPFDLSNVRSGDALVDGYAIALVPMPSKRFPDGRSLAEQFSLAVKNGQKELYSGVPISYYQTSELAAARRENPSIDSLTREYFSPAEIRTIGNGPANQTYRNFLKGDGNAPAFVELGLVEYRPDYKFGK